MKTWLQRFVHRAKKVPTETIDTAVYPPAVAQIPIADTVFSSDDIETRVRSIGAGRFEAEATHLPTNRMVMRKSISPCSKEEIREVVEDELNQLIASDAEGITGAKWEPKPLRFCSKTGDNGGIVCYALPGSDLCMTHAAGRIPEPLVDLKAYTVIEPSYDAPPVEERERDFHFPSHTRQQIQDGRVALDEACDPDLLAVALTNAAERGFEASSPSYS